jgi:hypothetical protein
MRGLRDNLTLDALRAGIDSSNLSDHLKELARTRLLFASEYIDDSQRLQDLIRPGRLIIVDLRDEYCVFHDIRPVIPREGGHAFHVIPAACSSDSGQAVGAKRRGWLLGTSFLGVTSSWLSFSASILL